MVHFKRTSILTKVVVLGMLIYLATTLLDMRGQIQVVQRQRDEMQAQATELQMQNQMLTDAIVNSDDPDVLEQAAREKGYIKEGEILYRDIAR